MKTLKYMKSVDRELQNKEHILVYNDDCWSRYKTSVSVVAQIRTCQRVTLCRVGKLSMMMSSYLVTPVSRKTSC